MRREWVHNGIREVKAIIIVYSRPGGVKRGVFKIHVRTTHLKVSHNFDTSRLQANSDANSTRTAPSASPLDVKGVRQSVVVTYNPSSIDQNQQLLVRFPNLGKDDLIVPGTARLAFTISLASKDVNRTVVQNLGRAIVKKLTIKISGKEVMSIDDSDVFHCYNDLWKTAPERANCHYQGIDASDNRNTTRIRVSAGNGDSSVVADKAIADAFGDRFFTPLNFELLESHMPFYQSALGDQLEYELTFNDYSRLIQATGDVDASYHIGGISLEYDMVTLPELARTIDNQYKGRLAILYDRVLRHRKMTMDKSNTLWNINLNVPARSMKGILMLFENVAAEQLFTRNTEAFYNPKDGRFVSAAY